MGLEETPLNVAIVLLAPFVIGFVLGHVYGIVVEHLRRRQWARDTARMQAMYERIIDVGANVKNYGTSQPRIATTSADEPSPEERATFEITEAMIERGRSELRAAYDAAGMTAVTDEDIDAEVRAALNSVAPRPPAVLTGLLVQD